MPLLAAASSFGCSVPLLTDLDEHSAAEVIVTLSHGRIGASKEDDPTHEGRYRVSVGSSDVTSALAVLQAAGLPTRTSPGVLESLGDAAMVPSRTSEQARLLVGIAGELERTLSGMEGILSARVHLAVPDTSPLDQTRGQVASASVLIRHLGVSPPLGAGEVQRLVAGAIAGLSPDNVAVIQHAVGAPTAAPGSAVAKLGPFSVASSSLPQLRWTLVGSLGLHALLALALIATWLRFRTRSGTQGSPPEGAA